MRRNKGFTLIELLVVIAIIGVLATIVLSSLSAARARARDAKRLEEFKQFQTALEIFHQDYGVYPCGDANDNLNGGTADSSVSHPFMDGGTTTNCVGTPNFGLHTAGLLTIDQPKDPINSVPYVYFYKASADRKLFLLSVPLEAKPDLMENDGGLCDNYYEVGSGVGQLTVPGTTFLGVPCN